MKNGKTLAVMAISQIALCTLIARECRAVPPADIDTDYPNALEVKIESTIDGNPLDDGDEIYSLSGSCRFFRGDLGLETSLGYAEPTSDFVHGRGDDAKLLLLDFSVVWYANYKYLNKFDRENGKPWHRNSRFKPELLLFGGPGLASLTIDDPFPGADPSKYFFTINAGFGAKIHWLRDDSEDQQDHHTSRFYLRTEVRARWFTGGDGELDWGVGVALGYSLGNRPSHRSLTLKAHEACKATERYLSEELVVPAGGDEQSLVESGKVLEKSVGYHQTLEALRAQIVTCGRRCEDVRPCLDDNIQKLTEVIPKIRSGTGSVD